MYAAPDDVSSPSTRVDFNFSATTDAAVVVLEYTGFDGGVALLGDSGSDTGSGSPVEFDLDLLQSSDNHLFIAGAAKSSSNTNLFEGAGDFGYTDVSQTFASSQYVGCFEKIVSQPKADQFLGLEYEDEANWAGVLAFFKEFPGDFSLTDSVLGYLLNESVQAETFDKQESDSLSVGDQTSILLVGGADGHPTDAPFPILIEGEGGVAKSSIEVEIRYGTGAYQHVFENESFRVPAGGGSVIDQTTNGWGLNIAPLGFWPRNTLITVKVIADSIPSPFEYSFTTADQAPEIRGLTIIQAAAGTT